MFKTEHGLLDAAVISLKEGCSRKSRSQLLSLKIDVFYYVVTMQRHWMFIKSVVISPLACVREHCRSLQFCPCVKVLHVSSLYTTLPLYGRSLRLLLFTNETNVKMPRCRFSVRLSYTPRSFSCCLTASTRCLDIPIKWTTGASSAS